MSRGFIIHEVSYCYPVRDSYLLVAVIPFSSPLSQSKGRRFSWVSQMTLISAPGARNFSPSWKYGSSLRGMTYGCSWSLMELSRGAENSKVMFFAAPLPMLRTTTSITRR